MLFQRVITALILGPLVIAAIYLLPLPGVAIVFWVVAALGVWEWSKLSGLTTVLAQSSFVGLFAITASLSWWFPASFAGLLWIGAGTWLLATSLVIAYPRSSPLVERGWLVAVLGQVIMLAAWVALVVVRDHENGANWLIWVLLLVWSADIGAYFAGRRFGHRKLAAAVSPGKTWEGFWGGMAASLFIGLGVLLIAGDSLSASADNLPDGILWVTVIVCLSAISVLGDLFESVLKRSRGVKDSGGLLPGHGGVLDRIDSILAVLPPIALVLGSL